MTFLTKIMPPNITRSHNIEQNNNNVKKEFTKINSWELTICETF